MISPVKLWRNQKKIQQLIGVEGEIVSFTIIRVPPMGFEDQAPYVVALVKIGPTMQIGQLVDISDFSRIKTNQKVKAVLRRVRKPDTEGVIPYGIKFKLV